MPNNSLKLSSMQALKPSGTQALRHLDTQALGYAGMQTLRHPSPQALEHSGTQVQVRRHSAGKREDRERFSCGRSTRRRGRPSRGGGRAHVWIDVVVVRRACHAHQQQPRTHVVHLSQGTPPINHAHTRINCTRTRVDHVSFHSTRHKEAALRACACARARVGCAGGMPAHDGRVLGRAIVEVVQLMRIFATGHAHTRTM